VPVVAARSGGIPDIVTDGVNGYLFEPEADVQSAIRATVRLLQQQQERETIRQNARREAERWGWAAATRQLETYYQKVIYSQLPRAA
jgi:glycosyltransferase involved in cell wall biosynthesis